MNNLSQRVLSAAVGAPILYFIIYLGGLWFFVFILVALALFALEFEIILAAKNKDYIKYLVPVFSVLIGIGAWFGHDVIFLTYLSVIFLVFIIEIFHSKPEGSLQRVGATLLGTAYIGLLFSHVILLRNPESSALLKRFSDTLAVEDPGLFFIVFITACTFANDTFAYVVGKTLGKHRFSPTISPSKTVEGTIGGIIGSAVCACIVNILFSNSMSLVMVIIWGLMIGIISLIGDLSESLIKRDAGIKDSGSVIPGHGGLLDRCDGLIFSYPASYFYLMCISYFMS